MLVSTDVNFRIQALQILWGQLLFCTTGTPSMLLSLPGRPTWMLFLLNAEYSCVMGAFSFPSTHTANRCWVSCYHKHCESRTWRVLSTHAQSVCTRPFSPRWEGPEDEASACYTFVLVVCFLFCCSYYTLYNTVIQYRTIWLLYCREYSKNNKRENRLRKLLFLQSLCFVCSY